VVVIGGVPDGGGAALVAAVSADVGIDASDLIAAGAKSIQGGGGKGKDLAMAGGRNGDGVPDALEAARRLLGI
jgi:alanyl-tRNA synthetase